MSPQNICKSKMFPQNLMKFPTNLMFSIIYFLLSFLCSCYCYFPHQQIWKRRQRQRCRSAQGWPQKALLAWRGEKLTIIQNVFLFSIDPWSRWASQTSWCHCVCSTSTWPSGDRGPVAEANFSSTCSLTREQTLGNNPTWKGQNN